MSEETEHDVNFHQDPEFCEDDEEDCILGNEVFSYIGASITNLNNVVRELQASIFSLVKEVEVLKGDLVVLKNEIDALKIRLDICCPPI